MKNKLKKIFHRFKKEAKTVPYMSIYSFHFIGVVLISLVVFVLIGMYAASKSIKLKSELEKINLEININQSQPINLTEFLKTINIRKNQNKEN